MLSADFLSIGCIVVGSLQNNALTLSMCEFCASALMYLIHVEHITYLPVRLYILSNAMYTV